jgi:DNA-binding response OmpR family regulator
MSRRRVRIIDDEPDMTLYLSLALEREGYDVETCNAVQPDLLRAEAWRDINVVICDLMMPNIAGSDVLAWLAAHAPHVKRVAWSGMPPELSDCPIDVYLQKPASTAEIIAAIGAVDG